VPDGTHASLTVSHEHERIQPVEKTMSDQETVMLVDDEPSLLRLAKRTLESRGYRVLAASCAAEALGMAEEHGETISLILTDVVMPEMNGWELSERILSAYPKIKLMFMSGYAPGYIFHNGILAEGVTLIQKPFSLNDLAAKIRETLDS